MSNYFYAFDDNKLFIRIVGKLKYKTSLSFDSFIENLNNHNIDNALIDLSNTDFIDSTNLGLIARIVEIVREKNGNKVTIISNTPDIDRVLKSVGFDNICIIIKKGDYNQDFEELKNIKSDEKEYAKLMLKAYKSLMAISKDNHEIFKDIVSIIEKDIK